MGQHLNNVVMYTPIRVGESDADLVGFFAVVMHWMDVGGITIGSCQSPFTTDIFQEGIQFRTVKLLNRGERVDEMFRMVSENTRFPKLVLGDLESQISGCISGRDMVSELVQTWGPGNIRAAIEQFWLRAEAATRAVIGSIPDGEYAASSFLDDDGIERGKPVEIAVKVIIRGDEATIDLSGVAAQLKGPLNSGYQGGAVAASRMAAKYVFSPDGPANYGAFKPIRVECPPGRFLSAGPTAPIGGSGFTIPSVVDTILRALAPCLPERIPAAHHGTYSVHVIDGHNEDGELFQHIESAAGGWGAAYDRDGGGPFRSMAHGDTLEVPVELQESSHPYVIEYARLRQDSGGAGRFRGGLGLEKAYRLKVPSRLTTSIERTACPPWGLNGGEPGVTGRVEVHRTDGSQQTLLKGETRLEAGDRVLLFTAGGGGFGDPAARDDDAITRDVMQGYVSSDVAKRVYGRAT
jgi:N-methylhydantoinase B